MTCNLVLAASWNVESTLVHLNQIASQVNQLGIGVQAHVVPHTKSRQLGLVRLWHRPTLSLSLQRAKRRKLLPGRYMTGLHLNKHEEYTRLDNAGVPIPAWRKLTPDIELDPDFWGPYVVEKPSTGRRGALVRIRKTNRVRFAAPDTYPPSHPGHAGPMLIQKFIYTGRWPASYRVVTLFGEHLLCFRQTSRRGHPLDDRWGFATAGGISIVSNTKDMTLRFNNDRAVIELAERAHRTAFPEVPSLAFDIVRDVESGELFVLECHPHGHWMFSSETGLQEQEHSRISFDSQFGATMKAARILAEATKRLATIRSPIGALRMRA